MRRSERASSPEFYVALDVVGRILSDGAWAQRARRIQSSEELRRLILEFCSENGAVVKVSKNVFLLFADQEPVELSTFSPESC